MSGQSRISEEDFKTLACFNGSSFIKGYGSLEKYLNLILTAAYPMKEDAYRLYAKYKDKILHAEENISEVFRNDEFGFDKTDNNHKNLWKMLTNASRSEYPSIAKVREVINYALDALTQYPFLYLENCLLGFRDSFPVYIVLLLDRFAWYESEEVLGTGNDEKNTLKIAHWIFGEDVYSGEGIIQKLSDKEKGILGLFDLLIFRMYCCVDRGGDIFNIMRGLIAHGNPKTPDLEKQNNLVIDEMREMSQVIFQIFQKRYIKTEENIFEEIDNITLEEFCSEYYGYVNSENDAGKINDLENEFIRQKAKYKSFIIYQLGTKIISHGIGCGYYDLKGNEDNHEINGLMNDYLFDICFNPGKDENNYICFLDYLFHNYSQAYIRDTEFGYIPNINEFTKVLSEDRLKDYWERHRDKIVEKKFQDYNKTVVTLNYEIAYSKEIQNLYKELDKLLKKETIRDRVDK